MDECENYLGVADFQTPDEESAAEQAWKAALEFVLSTCYPDFEGNPIIDIDIIEQELEDEMDNS